MSNADRALCVYDNVLNSLYKSVETLDLKLPAEYRHAQFAEAHAKLNEAIGLIEDLQYEAGMDHELEQERKAEAAERREYERLKSKFGA